MHAYMHTYIHTYVCTYIHTYDTYIHTYIRIYTYIQTYIHIGIPIYHAACLLLHEHDAAQDTPAQPRQTFSKVLYTILNTLH
jgi:hypothetical protein